MMSSLSVWRILSDEAQEYARLRLFVGGDIVIPGSFDYLVAKSVPEAVALLAQHGDEAKILAGGQSLIPPCGSASRPPRC